MIAGIDFDSNGVHVILLDEDTNRATWHQRRLDLGRGDSFDRARRVREVMPARAAWTDGGVVCVAIEEPMTRSFVAAAALMRVQGAILACLPSELVVVPLKPTEWKQACRLPSNASKEQVRGFVRGLWADEPPTVPQDGYDAWAIAYAGRLLFEKRVAA